MNLSKKVFVLTEEMDLIDSRSTKILAVYSDKQKALKRLHHLEAVENTRLEEYDSIECFYYRLEECVFR